MEARAVGMHPDRGGDLLDAVGTGGHEIVSFCSDPDTGLKAIIAVHSTVLGPALGGARFRPYLATRAALDDALRLSGAMTLKAACAGLDLGGGKSVIIGDPARDKTPQLLARFGRFVDSLGGTYVTAEDVGTTVEDMTHVRAGTAHVTGLPIEDGGSGDPSPLTAAGVAAAMRSAVRHIWGADSMEGRVVAIQGLGKVGYGLAARLREEGATVVAADVDGATLARAATELGVTVADPAEVLAVECDVLAPCALGGVLDEDTVGALRCRAVVGAANNQLASDDVADALAAAGITYVPDFVANAGGIVNIACEIGQPYDHDAAVSRVEGIGDVATRILDEADRTGATPLAVATRLAEERIEAHRPTSR